MMSVCTVQVRPPARASWPTTWRKTRLPPGTGGLRRLPPRRHRPARNLSKTVGCEFYGDREEQDVVQIGKRGLQAADFDTNLIIFDTIDACKSTPT